jgi:hypothetical protein
MHQFVKEQICQFNQSHLKILRFGRKILGRDSMKKSSGSWILIRGNLRLLNTLAVHIEVAAPFQTGPTGGTSLNAD